MINSFFFLFQIKKLKWEIIELKDKLEDFEGKAHLCEVKKKH